MRCIIFERIPSVMRYNLLDPWLLAWHASQPRLLIGTPEGVCVWAPDPGERGLASPRTALVTLGWWGDRVVLTDEEACVEVDGERLSPGLGRIDELAEGPDLGLVGDRFGALRPDGARRFAYLPPKGAAVWARWTGEGWLVRHESGAAVLDPEGAVMEEHLLDRDARVRWEGGLRVHRLSIQDPSARSHTLAADGTLVAEGREHVLYIQRGGELTEVAGHPRTVTAIGVAPDGSVLTGCRDLVLRRHDGALRTLERGHRAEHFAWSADGRWWAWATRTETWVAGWPPGD
ncbi:MAG: hypothetical protein ACI8S6_001953 [Myxococcota bacterium]